MSDLSAPPMGAVTTIDAASGVTEAGWYHVAGDPPGTMRRWNGVEWIGFPQPDPNIRRVNNQPIIIDSAPGQYRLFWWGLLAQLGLLIPVAGFGILSFVMWREASTIDTLLTADVFEIGNTDEFTTRFDRFMVGLRLAAGGQLIAGPLFILWFYLAYRNLSRLVPTRHHKAWAIFGWIIPFINWFMPGSMMSDLVHHSPANRRGGAINPILPNAWWGLFILPNIITPLIMVWVIRTQSVTDLRLMYWVLAATVTLTFVSAILAMVLIERVSTEQDMRLGPRTRRRR